MNSSWCDKKKYVYLGALFFLVTVSIFLFLNFDINSAFFYFCFLLAGLTFSVYAIWFFAFSHLKTVFGMCDSHLFLKSVVLSVFCSICFEAGTVFGSYHASLFCIDDWSKRRLLVFLVLSFAAAVAFLSFSARGVKDDKDVSELAKSSEDNVHRFGLLISSHPVLMTFLLMTIVLICVHCGFAFIFSSIGTNVVKALLLVIDVCVGIIFIVLLARLGILQGKVELVFLCLALSFGSFLALGLPGVTGVSWDDQIHYDRALGVSYLGYPEADFRSIELVYLPWAGKKVDYNQIDSVVWSDNNFSFDYERTEDAFFERDGFRTPVRDVSLNNLYFIGALPSAMGLWLGRLLHLPLKAIFILGRWSNLLAFVLVMTMAIRIAPTCKELLAVVGLLPTSLFLASSYSYDPVVTSFIAIGIALFCREYFNRDSCLTFSNLFLILGSLFIGFASKPIYCVLLGILLLMPKTKFNSDKEHFAYISLVVSLGLLMAASYLLPLMFSSSAQAGDARGGSNVNSVEQIKFILSNPAKYFSILGSFLAQYLSPKQADSYSVFYAYLGIATSHYKFLSAVPFAVLASTAAIGSVRNSFDEKGFSFASRIWMLFLVIFDVALVATALYISFTPVGFHTINGCQPRYLLPLIYPFCMAFGLLHSSDLVGRQVRYVPFVLAAGLSVFCDIALVVFV